MFDILMYLFENFIHSEVEIMVDHEELTDELTRAGFHKEEILKALAWLERLADLQDSDKHPYLYKQTQPAVRIYTADEMARIDTNCRGFLMFLEQAQVLDNSTREMVVDRVMELDMAEITLEDLKWVVLMVLFNVPGKEGAYSQMEDLLFDINEGYLN
ncbi:DUF494 family protein [Neiella marina]|uniref:Protein Smg homolog n=1 Tax=Neiella holothuriorum TaxID=2870530 RepID=A0ABS7EKD5_9GAMM|nr:DUF494 family protein [Neiella holothuriorum]MBW8192781.1 DUF494 family protein [Neiella holothuriorum]